MSQSSASGSRSGFSRRQFLHVAGTAVGALAWGVPTLLSARNVSTRLNVAHVGLGNQGRNRLKEMIRCPANVIAFCDVDETYPGLAAKLLPANAPQPKAYVDYRELLAQEKDLDAVIIASPDHWHSSLATAALQAGKHVFCEKPLTRTIAEARALRELSRTTPGLVTQMGNQGSSFETLRRAIEIIQAGAIGPVREVHCWVAGAWGTRPGCRLPQFGDAIPAGLHWDAWLGPAPDRYYKKGWYHPWAWRTWFDFGTGVIGNFGCHSLNLPYRALQLDYPVQIKADGEYLGFSSYSKKNRIQFDFAARGELPPVTLWWYDCGLTAPASVIPPTLLSHLGEIPEMGVLILGENGYTFGDAWNGASYIQLKNEPKLSSILTHPATRSIPRSLPRTAGHVEEWVSACAGGPPTFSSFELGGHLTEIVLSGIVALRTDKKLQWNGPDMRAENTSRAQKYIRQSDRVDWKI